MKENTYYTVMSFMVDDLRLKGIELQIYAIIHGFSQDDESSFKGSIKYLQDWTSASRPTIINGLASLVGKGLLEKKENFIGSIKLCEYKALGKKILPLVKKSDGGSKEILPAPIKKLDGGSKKTLPNNINDNKDDIKEDNLPPTPFEITKRTLDEIAELIVPRDDPLFDKYLSTIGWAVNWGGADIQALYIFVKDYMIVGNKDYETFMKNLRKFLGEQQ